MKSRCIFMTYSFIFISKCLVSVASCSTHTHTQCSDPKVACAMKLVDIKPQKMFELQVEIAQCPVLLESAFALPVSPATSKVHIIMMLHFFLE
jgi:hypothetical protein